MATLKHSLGDHHVLDTATPKQAAVEDTIEARRARRMAALKKAAGIWAHRTDIPADGLEYQRQLRSEDLKGRNVRIPYELETVSTTRVVNVDPPGETPAPNRGGPTLTRQK